MENEFLETLNKNIHYFDELIRNGFEQNYKNLIEMENSRSKAINESIIKNQQQILEKLENLEKEIKELKNQK